MPYSYLTLAQIRTMLAQRLADTGATLFWSDVEKNRYIREALRTWNSLANFWRAEFIITLSTSEIWYDISNLSNVPNTLRPLTLSDNDITQDMEYSLLEPVTAIYPLTWTGSLQFSIIDLLNSIQRIRDEVLSITGCQVTQANVNAVPGRTFLSDKAIDIRRVAWLPVTNPSGYINNPLWRDDTFSLQAYDNTFATNAAGTPFSYQQSAQPPLSFDVDTQPAVNGLYDVITVNAGAALSTVNFTLLGIPDDFSWVIKWGALADLLNKEPNAKDSFRAKYALTRYQQGLAALMLSPAVLVAKVNNNVLDIDSVQNGDSFRPSWQGATPAQPTSLYTAGLNIFGFPPIDQTYSVSATVVQNAPVPINDNDQVQVGRDVLEAVLDYSQHIAMFKVGGAEFMSTLPLMMRFNGMAAAYNSRLNELGPYTKAMYEMSQLQSLNNPVFEEDPTKQV